MNFTGVEFLRSLSTQVYKEKIKKETQPNKTTIFSRLLFASSIKSEIWIFHAVKWVFCRGGYCLHQKKNRQTIWVALEIKAVKETADCHNFRHSPDCSAFRYHTKTIQGRKSKIRIFSVTSRNPLSEWFPNFFVSQKPASLIQLMKRWLAIHINTIIMMYMKCTELK